LPLVAAVASTLVVGACDDDDGPTGPSTETNTEAMVVDEPEGSSTYSGDMAGDFQFAVSADGETWTDVGSPNGITLLLQDDSEVSVHGAQDAPLGTFPRVRLTIRNADVTIEQGSEIGGTTLASDATVSVGGPQGVIIEREITVPSLEEGEDLHVTFDLNSETWLTLDAVTSGLANDAAVAAAASVSTVVSTR
jgi:hypothetical protein